MHVSWHQEPAGCGSHGNSCTLTAVLVETFSSDGIERTRPVVAISSIQERFLDTRARDLRAFHQGLFWEKAARQLDRVNLDPGERDAVEAELSRRVPRPDRDWPLWAVTCIPRLDPR